MWSCALVATLILVALTPATEGQAAFGCKNALISDEWRSAVLNFHNDYRRKITQGTQLTDGNKKKMPQAKDMFQLNWDCNLEHNAWENLCDNNVAIPATYVETEQVVLGGRKNCNITEKTLAALKTWWNEANSKDLSANPQYTAADIPNFGRMATGQAKGFACTYRNCDANGDSKLVCIYSKKLNDQENLYEVANAQNVCSCNGATCVYQLCQEKYTAVTDANPQPNCNNDGMTLDMQNMAKNMHNYYRRLLATGWAQDKSGYAPPAKQMTPVEYDCAVLGAAAKAEADDCTKNQYTAQGKGLNYAKFDYDVTREDALRKAISQWWLPLKNVDVDDQGQYTTDIENKAKTFANMVFQGTTKIGCAATQCTKQGFTVALCIYENEPQNGDPLYTVGKTCSGCRTSNKKCDPLLGLCIP